MRKSASILALDKTDVGSFSELQGEAWHGRLDKSLKNGLERAGKRISKKMLDISRVH